MGWESFGVVRFDLGPLLQGQTSIAKLKSSITHLLLVLEVWDVKPTCRKSCAGNLLVWTDLTLGLSFKVKRAYPNLNMLLLLCSLKDTVS